MFKRNYLNTALVATSAVLLSSAAVAQETVTGNATVNVSNAFTITETSGIDFGSLRVFTDITASTGEVVVTIPGNTNPMTLEALVAAEADGNILAQGAPGVYAIAGAAPFTPLTITFPSADTVTLANAAAPPATPSFIVNFDPTTTYIVGGANDGQLLVPATTDLTTDAAGEVGFSLGGILNTNAAATATYADGDYVGTFSLIVNY
ncbi:MAG: hypothetical protein ACJAVV_001267 [Alphaproteobacteria bacterium]|jgi:hypothetical protein